MSHDFTFNSLWGVIDYLREPVLVAEVQQYFGVKLNKVKDDDSKRTESAGKVKINASSSDSNDFEIQNSFWYYLFLLGTALGDEIFYASFIPFWFWNIDGAVGRRVVCVWTISMYIGQGMKDIVKWPRPTHPAKRLQKKWAEEHGMPSTHAMVGICIPLSIILYTKDRYIYSVPLGGLVTFCWCSLICVSRIYLGMHSILDIVAGLILALLLMVPMVPLVNVLDNFLLTEIWSPIIIFAVAIVVIMYFPHSDHWTPTWGDTAMIISVCTGILIGSWTNYQVGSMVPYPLPPPYAILWPNSTMLGFGALRTMLGFALVFLTRTICKSWSKSLLCWALNVDLSHLKLCRDLNHPRFDADLRTKATIVELSCKFITYFTIGFMIVCTTPCLFRYLGIERPTFYTEI